MWSSEPRKGLAACSVKAVPAFLSYFKTLSIGSAPGIKPVASRSVVKCSTDWNNPAVVKNERKGLCYKNKSILRRNSKCTCATIHSCRLIKSAHTNLSNINLRQPILMIIVFIKQIHKNEGEIFSSTLDSLSHNNALWEQCTNTFLLLIYYFV